MTAIAALAALLVASPPVGPAGAGPEVVRFQGVARSRDGVIAYVEDHEVRLANGQVVSAETRYRSPDGKPIARLVSAYEPGSFAPDYEFHDLRTGLRELVRKAPDGVRLQEGERSKVLPFPDDVPLVAGQGLDRYARAHLDRLARGEELKVSLALPGRLDTFGFQLRGERLPGGLVRVRFEPSSFVLRLLAPSLVGDYDPGTHRLVRYVGVSNVAAEDGSSQQVEIAYSYAEPDRS